MNEAIEHQKQALINEFASLVEKEFEHYCGSHIEPYLLQRIAHSAIMKASESAARIAELFPNDAERERML